MELEDNAKYTYLDFPMRWHQEELREDGPKVLAEAYDKLTSLEHTTNMLWRKFTTNLVICYEEYLLQNNVKALEALARCTTDIKGLKASGDPLSTYSPEALEHVVNASRGLVLVAMPGLLAKGTTILKQCFTSFKENIKRTEFQSALIGIRSAVFMSYGVPGIRKAREYIVDAIKLDDSVAEWHFINGKCMGRLRRLYNHWDVPSDYELNQHTLAVTLTERKVPYYIAYLAQCQRETAFRISQGEEIAESLPEKSVELYELSCKNYYTAYQMAPECSHVVTRCALGFLKMPDRFNNSALAHKIMEKILKISPENPMVNHIWALINERALRNTSEALQYFQNTAEMNVFVGWIDLIRLTYLENKNSYNPVIDLTNLIDIFDDGYIQERILVQIGSFYFFQKNDTVKSLEYINRVLNDNPDSQLLTIHRSIFMGLGHPINLIQAIFDECRFKCGNPHTRKFLKRHCLEAVLFWTSIHPELTNKEPKDFRRSILDESFVYTHPWINRRGRERKRRDNKGERQETRGRCKSLGRAQSTGRNKPDFVAYFPNYRTILKGWLSEQEQLENFERRFCKNEVTGPLQFLDLASSVPQQTAQKDRKTENWRQHSISSDLSMASTCTRSDADKDWRSGLREHRDSTTSNYSSSVSLETETQAAAVNWRAECRPVGDTGGTEPMGYSQSPHWIQRKFASGTGSQSPNFRQGSPSTSTSSDNRNWRSRSLGEIDSPGLTDTKEATTAVSHRHNSNTRDDSN